jgi:hypothetical protein
MKKYKRNIKETILQFRCVFLPRVPRFFSQKKLIFLLSYSEKTKKKPSLQTLQTTTEPMFFYTCSTMCTPYWFAALLGSWTRTLQTLCSFSFPLSKSCQCYLRNVFWMNSLLLHLVQGLITSWLDYFSSSCQDFSAIFSFTLVKTQPDIFLKAITTRTDYLFTFLGLQVSSLGYL